MPVNSPSSKPLAYRSDIDGLRAIAVLSVIAFHINEKWLPGGFLGVDIFFVISGYLISLLLLKEINATGTVSFLAFYERRIRRIMPALLLVISCTVIAGLLLLTPDKLKELCQSANWSLVSLANIYFFQSLDTSYFADDSREIPLLHLWSLGVEEQFYFIWPLSLLWIATWKSRWLRLFSIASLLIASLTAAQFILPQHPDFAYYWLPTRAWELMAGALVATLVATHFTLGKRTANLLSLVAVSVIYCSVTYIEKDDAIPGLAAAPIISATALLLWAGTAHQSVFHRLLSLKPLVGIGLISYSAYLWHWPLLAFTRYATASLDIKNSHGALAFLGSLLLAAITYQWVETPLRTANVSRRTVYQRYLLLPVIVIVAATQWVTHNITQQASWVIDWPRYEAAIKVDQQAYGNAVAINQTSDEYLSCSSGTVYDQRLDNNPYCYYPLNASPPRIIVVGDSNADHFLPMIRSFADTYRFSFTHRTQKTCPFFLDDKPIDWIFQEYQPACQAYRAFMLSHLNDYDTFIIGGTWTAYDKKTQRHAFRERLTHTVAMLSQAGKTVVLLGKIPRFSAYNHYCESRAVKLSWLQCHAQYNFEQPEHEANLFLRDLANRYANVRYFGIRNSLCTHTACSPYFEGATVYADGDHLNRAGAAAVAKSLLRKQDPSLAVFQHLPPPATP